MAGRGANGRSTIVKQDDGRWHGFVSMGAKGDGSRDRRHVSAATRAAVVEKVKSLEAKRDAGMVSASGKAMFVDEWLDYWAENIASVRVRARTLATYRTMIRLHLNPYIGKRRLDQLQPEHLEQTYKQLLDKRLSPASVLRVHRMLHRALKIAMQRDRVARNVATLVEPPRQERPKTPEPLDVEECKRVLTAAEGLRNSARWTVALALGLRQSEALALQWKDIDFDRSVLSVRRGLHRVPGEGLVFTEPKTDRSRRDHRCASAAGRSATQAARCAERGAAGRRHRVGRLGSRLRPAERPATGQALRLRGVDQAAEPRKACGTSACTTAATPRRRCCSPPASILVS